MFWIIFLILVVINLIIPSIWFVLITAVFLFISLAGKTEADF